MNKKERILDTLKSADAETLKEYIIDIIRETIEEEDIVEGTFNGNVYEDDNTKRIEDYYINDFMIDINAVLGEE